MVLNKREIYVETKHQIEIHNRYINGEVAKTLIVCLTSAVKLITMVKTEELGITVMPEGDQEACDCEHCLSTRNQQKESEFRWLQINNDLSNAISAV